MHRFFVSPEDVSEDVLIISGSDARHAALVMRLRIDSKLLAIDGTGKEYEAVVTSIDSAKIEAKIIETRTTAKEANLKTILIQSLLKGDKMELVVQKCTELGINSIVPCETSRSIIKSEEYNKSNKIARLRKIVQESSKQCGRSVIPFLTDAIDFNECFELVSNRGDDCLFIVPWEMEKEKSLKELFETCKSSQVKEIVFFVGPEGGFTVEEIEKLVFAGAKTVTLGPRILRAETAAIAMTVMSLYAFGDMG